MSPNDALRGSIRKYTIEFCPNTLLKLNESGLPIKGLVTNYGEGGATKREGGAREVLPLRKGGAGKVLAILKGGHKKFWGSF